MELQPQPPRDAVVERVGFRWIVLPSARPVSAQPEQARFRRLTVRDAVPDASVPVAARGVRRSRQAS